MPSTADAKSALAGRDQRKAAAAKEAEAKKVQEDTNLRGTFRLKGEVFCDDNLKVYKQIKGSAARLGKCGWELFKTMPFHAEKKGVRVWCQEKFDGYQENKQKKAPGWSKNHFLRERLPSMYNEICAEKKGPELPVVYVPRRTSTNTTLISDFKQKRCVPETIVFDCYDVPRGARAVLKEASVLPHTPDPDSPSYSYMKYTGPPAVELDMKLSMLADPLGAGATDLGGASRFRGDPNAMDDGMDEYSYVDSCGSSLDEFSDVRKYHDRDVEMEDEFMQNMMEDDNEAPFIERAYDDWVQHRRKENEVGGNHFHFRFFEVDEAGVPTGVIDGAAAPPMPCFVVPAEISSELWDEEDIPKRDKAVHALTRDCNELTFVDIVPLCKFEELHGTALRCLEMMRSKTPDLAWYGRSSKHLRGYAGFEWLHWCDYDEPGFDAMKYPMPPKWLATKDDVGLKKALANRGVVKYTETMERTVRAGKIEKAKDILETAKRTKSPEIYQALLKGIAKTGEWREFDELADTVGTLEHECEAADYEITGIYDDPHNLQSEGLQIVPKGGAKFDFGQLSALAKTMGKLSGAQVAYTELKNRAVALLEVMADEARKKLRETVDEVLATQTVEGFRALRVDSTRRSNLKAAIGMYKEGSADQDRALRAAKYLGFEVCFSADVQEKLRHVKFEPIDPVFNAAYAHAAGKDTVDAILTEAASIAAVLTEDIRAMETADELDELENKVKNIWENCQAFLDTQFVGVLLAHTQLITDTKTALIQKEKAKKRQKNAGKGMEKDGDEDADELSGEPAAKKAKTEKKAKVAAAKSKVQAAKATAAKSAAAGKTGKSAGSTKGKAGGRNKDLFDGDYDDLFGSDAEEP